MPPSKPPSPLPAALRWAGPLLAAGYGLGQRIHRACTTPRRAPLPVICVGNITAGGTGKTPATIFLARELCKRGHRPAVLMRGYKAQGTDEAAEVEAALREQNVPVILNSNRLAGAHDAKERGCDIALLDDGFQHWRLQRDLDIVLIDATAPFGAPGLTDGRLLPYGYLREKPTALARAGVVILTRSDCVAAERARELSEQLRVFAPDALHLTARHDAAELKSVGKGPFVTWPLPSLSGKNILAACGIGNPDGFRHTLEQLGARIVEFKAYDDHHRYTAGDVAQLLRSAKEKSVWGIVVTAKDSAKIAAVMNGKPEIPIVELTVGFVVNDPDALWKKIAAALKNFQSRARQ